VVRQLIRDYLAQHGVQYVASGALPDAAGEGADNAPPPPVPLGASRKA
jgi:hypothetical protein